MTDVSVSSSSAVGTGGDPGTGGVAAGIGGVVGSVASTSPAWYETAVQDAEAKAWLANKGWSDLPGMVSSHRSLEKMVGAPADQLIKMPQKGDEAGWRGVYERLGAPKDVNGYKFDAAPEGWTADENYQNWARGVFHKFGLSADAAKGLVAEHNKYVADHLTVEAKNYEDGVNADIGSLRSEWRGGYEHNMAKASSVAKILGFTGEMIDGMEKGAGYAGVMKFMVGLGQKLGEDKFVTTSDGTRGFGVGMSPEDAKAQLDAMNSDQNVVTALMNKDNPGHKAAVEKRQKLFGIMYGNG